MSVCFLFSASLFSFVLLHNTVILEWLFTLCLVILYLLQLFIRGAKDCSNRTLCEELLNPMLPAKPPFHPRQFEKCAVVGNSGDLLKTEFGEEIDSHDAVIRDNEAPVNEVNQSPQILAIFRIFS